MNKSVFSAQWTVVPLVPMNRAVTVRDSLDQAIPLSFLVPAGQTLTLQYDTVLPADGKLMIETDISGADGRHLQTTVEVFPP